MRSLAMSPGTGHGGGRASRHRQAASVVDPKEMAAVQRIRALIEERGKKTASAPSAAYTVTIPNTTVTYGMARVAAGEFLMVPPAPAAELTSARSTRCSWMRSGCRPRK